jgi:hypothetical protein
VFGSSAYDPSRARDLDVLVVVDRLESAREKAELEVARLLRGRTRKPADVLVLDEEALEENMEPGGIASGLLAGYLALYDELGLEELVARAAEKIASEGYILQKGGRRIDFGALARARRLTRPKPPQRLEADSGGRDSLSSHAA